MMQTSSFRKFIEPIKQNAKTNAASVSAILKIIGHKQDIKRIVLVDLVIAQ